MGMEFKVIVCAVLLFSGETATYRGSRELEGYYTGAFNECPDYKTIISQRSLHKLSFSVRTAGNMLTGGRRKYTYFQMKELAKDPDLDFNRKTMLYIGGFLDSPTFIVATGFGVVYRKLGYNVLLLDTNYFTTIEYPVASRFMRSLGERAAEMLVELTNLGLDPKKLELVGLSLGAHTASYIAKNYRLLTGINISRIVALDSSGPCFRTLGPEDRIDNSDADFVMTVNTNIDVFGMAAPIGHVNFYINGGEYQPGHLYWMYNSPLDSHLTSVQVWIVALLNPNSFIGMRCDSVQRAREHDCYGNEPQVTNVLGSNTDPNKPGIFYLATTDVYPFYLAEKGLKRDNNYFISKFRSLSAGRALKI